MLALEAVEKSFGTRAILKSVSWALPRNARIGLVGPNGAGKTTFLRVLVGSEEIDSGRVIHPKSVHVGFLPQEIALSEREGTLIETVLRGREDLLAIEAELAGLEPRLAESDEIREVYATLQEKFRVMGGYEFRSRAREISVGIGFKEADFNRPIVEFSGGWQMRALLARLLFRRPDLLLLDEPTNHLDLLSIEWLERFLGRYEGTVIIVSHDRYFLNRMVDQIAELDNGRLTLYPGNYDQYRRTRAEERERQTAAALRQGKEIERVEAFIDRFRSKATKAAQVQSRIKQLDKLERLHTPDAEASTVSFRFPQPPRLGKVVVEGRELAKAFGDNVVYENLNFVVHRGERVALVGPNGAGKTTLLRMLAGVDAPDRGTVELGNKVEVAYFAQHALESLDPNHSVLEAVQAAATSETSGIVRDMLGAFKFSGDDSSKKISVLSGGEKSRVALCRLLMNPAGLLLLDEPTNHLDIATRQVLEEAMCAFEGAIVLVSHDRFFVNEVSTHVVHVENGNAIMYVGNYDNYRLTRLAAEEELVNTSAEVDTGGSSRKDVRRLLAELRARKQSELKEQNKEFSKVEKRIETLEQISEDLRAQQMLPEVYSDSEKMRDVSTKLRLAAEELEKCLGRWEELGEQIEEVEARYREEESGLRD